MSDDYNPFRGPPPRDWQPEEEIENIFRRPARARITVTPQPQRTIPPPAEPVPEGAPSGDPTYDLFVPREAQTTTDTWGERAGATGRLMLESGTAGMSERAGASISALTGGAASYADALKLREAEIKKLREENPSRAFFADATGSMIGGLGMSGAGLTLAKGGVGGLQRAARGGIEGFLQGGAQGAGMDYGDWNWNKANEAGKGATLGAIFGTGIPATGSAASAVRNVISPRQPGGVPPSIARNVPGQENALANLHRMGPEVMLTEVPSFQRIAQVAAASEVEPQSSLLRQNLRNRDVETVGRVRRGATDALGPNVIPSFEENALRAQRQALRPEYEQVIEQQGRAVNTQPIDDWLRTQEINAVGDKAAAAARARSFLRLTGTDQLDPHPRKLQAARDGINDMMDDLKTRGLRNTKTFAMLSEAHQRMTAELQERVPGIAMLDARYAELAERSKALESGQKVFAKGGAEMVRPDELALQRMEMEGPHGPANLYGPFQPSRAPEYSTMGTRSAVSDVLGTQGNDLVALRNALGLRGDYNFDKLMIQFNARSADDVEHLLNTNEAFRRSYQKIVEGSKTAETVGGQVTFRQIPKRLMDFLELGLEKIQHGKKEREDVARFLSSRDPEVVRARIRQLQDIAPSEEARQVTNALMQQLLRTGSIGAIRPTLPKQKIQ